METTRDIVIIGSGPAGFTAGIYAARANLKPLIIEGLLAGGQLTTTTMVENYPGFREGVLGSDLMDAMRAQAERFGTEIVEANVSSVDLDSRPFRVTADGVEYHSSTVIVATGASARLLGLPAERALMGRGVSTCATCDGAFFRGRPIAVVGGGDSALEEALYLTRFASKVTLVHRRDRLRGSKIMQEKVFANSRIDVAWCSVVHDITDAGKGEVSAVVLKNVTTGALTEIPVDGVFVAIGHSPNTKLFTGQLEFDQNGYIVTTNGTNTSVPGVFACGDVQDPTYRQAITAAASGCMAAIDAERFLAGTRT